FTDPTYGIDSNYEGMKADSKLDGSHIYRIDPATGAVSRVADDFVQPNGLAFSPDERRLYIADSGATHLPDGPRHIRAFNVDGDRLSGGEVFARLDAGLFDGFRLDEDGRVWTSAGKNVHCYGSDGSLLGKILIGEQVANVVFGGPKRNRLFICASTSLYSVLLPVSGAKAF
ncbi:MAG: SMP-30/gluconolactonase/LRE family protein, partial [Amphiplicatus sp.]